MLSFVAIVGTYNDTHLYSKITIHLAGEPMDTISPVRRQRKLSQIDRAPKPSPQTSELKQLLKQVSYFV